MRVWETEADLSVNSCHRCGKTTLARLLAHASGAAFKELSATSAGINDVRSVFDEAKSVLQLTGRCVCLVPVTFFLLEKRLYMACSILGRAPLLLYAAFFAWVAGSSSVGVSGLGRVSRFDLRSGAVTVGRAAREAHCVRP